MAEYTAALSSVRAAFPALEIRENERMRNHTSIKIGGRVTAMLLPESVGELQGVLTFLKSRGLRTLVLGNGTNMLVDDRDLDLFVVKTGGVQDMACGEGEVTASCGVSLARLAMFSADCGLAGLEFAHGIPGTLGGATLMNAGAYGGEMKNVVIQATVLSDDGTVQTIGGDALGFVYRGSRFSASGEIILSCVLGLRPDDSGAIRARIHELAERRRQSQPLNLPSAGSTFKRPATGYAAAMIDEAGLKGYTVGGAAVSPKHAGFVVNQGDASFDDAMAVIRHVQDTVYEKFGVLLEPEVKIIR